MAFSSRGITDLTITRLGDVNVFAKPQFEQLAYSGYKNSIEAFMYATEIGKKVSTQSRSFPTGLIYPPTVPIKNASISFKLAARKPSQKFTESFDKSIEKLNGKKTQSGQTTIYTIPNCPAIPLSQFEKVAADVPVYVENHASPAGATQLVIIKYFIDLFLRTHIYEATREEGFPSGDGRLQVWASNNEAIIGSRKIEVDNTVYPNTKRMKVKLYQTK